MGLLGDLFDALFGEPQAEDELAGTTEDTATPLKRMLPLFCRLEDLEPDIKYNLEHAGSDRVFNFRTLRCGTVEYLVTTSTSIDRNTGECMVDYTMVLSSSFGIFYNLYELLELFLRQIREKKGGIYDYHLSKEVRQKMPVFCKLLDNARKNDENLTYGLPFITFLDQERKYPLLCAYFEETAISKEGDMDKLHISLVKIVVSLVAEVNKAGLLDQSKKTLVNNGLRMMRIMFNLGSD